jgi:hypothetical protein
MKSKFSTMICFVSMFWVLAAFTSAAQTFKTLANFDATNGSNPSQLVQG